MFHGSYIAPSHKPTRVGICELYIYPAVPGQNFLTFDIFTQAYETYVDNVLATLPYLLADLEKFQDYLPSARIVVKNKPVPEGTKWTTELIFTIGGEGDWEFFRTLQDREWVLVAKLNSGSYLQIGTNQENALEGGAIALIDYDSGNRSNANGTDYKFVWESSHPPIEIHP